MHLFPQFGQIEFNNIGIRVYHLCENSHWNGKILCLFGQELRLRAYPRNLWLSPKESREWRLRKKSIGYSPILLDVNTKLSQKREETSTDLLVNISISSLNLHPSTSLTSMRPVHRLPDDRFHMSRPDPGTAVREGSNARPI